jgi:hypothetical protein
MAALGLTRGGVEELAGLQPNYCTKVILPNPMKKMSLWTAFLLLETLSLNLTVTENPCPPVMLRCRSTHACPRRNTRT